MQEPASWRSLIDLNFSREAMNWWKWIEQEFASRWMVWAGGAIMALGVIFLLKMGSDYGLFGPGLRTGAAATLSLAMVAGSEWLRGSRFQLPLANSRYVPAALAGAGVIGLYATLLAGKNLYELYPVSVLFIGLIAVSLLAMLLALRQGAFMAALGILGAYIVPLFVSTGSGNMTALLFYTALVSFVSIALMTRVYRCWLWRGAMIGNYLWLAISFFYFPQAHQPARSLFLLLTSWGFLAWPHLGWQLRSKTRRRGGWEQWPAALKEPLLTGLVATLMLVGLTVAEEASLLASSTLVIGCFALLLLARRSPSLDLFALMAATAAIAYQLYIAHNRSFLWTEALPFLIALAIIFGGYGLYCLTQPLLRKIWWAALATGIPLTLVAAVYFSAPHSFEPILKWVIMAVCLAVYFGWNLFSDIYRRLAYPVRTLIQAAAQLALLFGLYICFSGVTLTILLGLQLLLLTLWERWRSISLLHWILKAQTLLLTLRLSFNPAIMDYPSPLHFADWTLPWTLYGFGLPVLCLWLSAKCYPGRADKQMPGWLTASALYLLSLWLNIELRHLLHGSYRLSLDFASLSDCALHGLTFGIMAVLWGYRAASASALSLLYRWASAIGFGCMLLFTAASLTLFNPLWSAQNVGGLPILNLVTVAFALPALVLTVALLYGPKQFGDIRLKPWLAGTIAVLSTVFITLTVRQLWHGERLDSAIVFAGEQYCYSLTWMCVAIVVMYASIRWPNILLRRAALTVLAVIIAKLFLWDMAELRGFYRPLSFLGLGLCLIAVGWCYQKFVVMALSDKKQQSQES
ncbi:DUF2339 domain-containing protein [Kalamiella sp. sgz302252]|uniref:DUF2339 domain-containing protein n=1 Tax=Pantoea sp. sgz302252 TaxID=3341827 RepID=UPI0036D2C08A